jgi:hypothetical protein
MSYWMARLVELLNSKPVLALSVAFGIFGLPLALWAWWDSKAEPGVTYFVSPSTESLVVPIDVGDLALSFKGRPLSRNAYVDRIYIWNDGKRVVSLNEIRPSLRII